MSITGSKLQAIEAEWPAESDRHSDEDWDVTDPCDAVAALLQAISERDSQLEQREATIAELRAVINGVINGPPPQMSSTLGLLPINSEGMRTLVDAVIERDATIAELRQKIDLSIVTIEGLEIAERELIAARLKLAELRKPVAGRRCAATTSTDPPSDCDAPFCGCNPEWHVALDAARESGWLTSAEASTLQAELSELRKPVAVALDSSVEQIRVERRDGGLNEYTVYDALDILLSAYDTLAQNHARAVNAREMGAAEMRGLRERLERRGKRCTCDTSNGGSIPCYIESGGKLGDLWYCAKSRQESGNG